MIWRKGEYLYLCLDQIRTNVLGKCSNNIMGAAEMSEMMLPRTPGDVERRT